MLCPASSGYAKSVLVQGRELQRFLPYFFREKTMKGRQFTWQEVEAKVGQRVVTTANLVGIPKGTTGLVVHAESTLDGNFIVVRWDLPWVYTSLRRRWPYEDWFSKFLYHRYLLET